MPAAPQQQRARDLLAVTETHTHFLAACLTRREGPIRQASLRTLRAIDDDFRTGRQLHVNDRRVRGDHQRLGRIVRPSDGTNNRGI
ncbi:MAG TPA: hypothetical protein VMG10_27155 [Gemmataceae bacterium]|nr:hypothetical protein [Gemmataceae bacterium]